MDAGFLVHCANADVEAVLGETGLNTVNPVTDSQVWQSIPIVWLVLLLAMLMSFGLDCCCDWFSIVCRTWFGHHGESESFGSVPDAVGPALETKPRMPMRDVTEHEMETERERRGLLLWEVEDVVGALTPVVGGVAQVFHDLLVELWLLLVAEVEEGGKEDRQEEG